jgi:hypothetical protein
MKSEREIREINAEKSTTVKYRETENKINRRSKERRKETREMGQNRAQRRR